MIRTPKRPSALALACEWHSQTFRDLFNAQPFDGFPAPSAEQEIAELRAEVAELRGHLEGYAVNCLKLARQVNEMAVEIRGLDPVRDDDGHIVGFTERFDEADAWKLGKTPGDDD